MVGLRDKEKKKLFRLSVRVSALMFEKLEDEKKHYDSRSDVIREALREFLNIL